MNLKNNIPNFITCLNLVCGMAGIYLVLVDNLYLGAYFVLIAAVFDFLDGFLAKLLRAQSEIGKQLDSLADVVTFGVLPSFIAFKMIELGSPFQFLPYLGFLIGVQSAVRLAKFNIDTRQSDRFIGVPTPACALFFSTLPHLGTVLPSLGDYLTHPTGVSVLVLVFAFLLTAELPLLALKFKSFAFKPNLTKYLLLLCGLIALATWGIGGIPFVIFAYLALSIADNLITKDVVG